MTVEGLQTTITRPRVWQLLQLLDAREAAEEALARRHRAELEAARRR